MKCMPLLAALLIGAVAPMASHAICTAGNCEGTGAQVVRTVFVHPTGDIWLKAPIDKAALNCTLVEGYYMVLTRDHPLFKESYAAILTALARGMKWMVRVVEGSPVCEVNYVLIYAD